MSRKTVAYIAPFLIFVVLLGISQWLDSAHLLPGGLGAMYAVFPLQTAVCFALLAWFWRDYEMAMPRNVALAAGAGVLVFGFGFPRRF